MNQTFFKDTCEGSREAAAVNDKTYDSGTTEQTPAQHNETMSGLARTMRYMGAIALIGAGITFLFQHWTEFDNHQLRYFSFLGFSILLTICGFFCGVKIKDDKGARTFLGLSAAIVPIHFAQLGAMLYSLFADPAHSYPLYLAWKAVSVTQAVSTVSIGLVSLSVITLIAFTALCRRASVPLTAIYIFLNCFFLLPFRDVNIVSAILLALCACTLYAERWMVHRFTEMKTAEGTFVRIMLIVPLVLIFGRTFLLYSASAIVIASVFATISLVLFAYLPRVIENSTYAVASQHCSAFSSAIACMIIIAETGQHYPGFEELTLLAFGMLFSIVLLLKSFYALDRGVMFRRVATLVLLASAAFQSLFFPAWYYALICIIASIVGVVLAHMNRDKIAVFSSLTAFALGILHYLQYAADLYRYSPWLSLAVVGTLTVICSSVIERHKEAIRHRLQYYLQK